MKGTGFFRRREIRNGVADRSDKRFGSGDRFVNAVEHSHIPPHKRFKCVLEDERYRCVGARKQKQSEHEGDPDHNGKDYEERVHGDI